MTNRCRYCKRSGARRWRLPQGVGMLSVKVGRELLELIDAVVRRARAGCYGPAYADLTRSDLVRAAVVYYIASLEGLFN